MAYDDVSTAYPYANDALEEFHEAEAREKISSAMHDGEMKVPLELITELSLGAKGRDDLVKKAKDVGADAARNLGYKLMASAGGQPGDTRACPRCNGTLNTRYFYSPPYCECQQAAYDEAYQAVLKAGWGAAVEFEWKDAGIPKRFRDKRFENFKPLHGTEDALRACRRYVEAFKPGETSTGLVLMGEAGLGKTHLATAIGRALLEEHLVKPVFVSVLGLLAEIRAGENGRFEWSGYNAAKRAELLIVDDLGQELPRPWVKEKLMELLDERYRAELPTLFTTNRGDADLENAYSRPFVSRIYEMVGGPDGWVFMEGEDYRRVAHA